MSLSLWLLSLATAALVAVLMEPWAAFLHGRIWHRSLWFLHRSHHRPSGPLEANDLFSLLHVPPSVALILWGTLVEPGVLPALAFGTGLGMTAFGVGYFVVHDGLVHGRLPVGFLARIPWLARVRDAHLEHHRIGGAPFGLFLGPRELARRRR